MARPMSLFLVTSTGGLEQHYYRPGTAISEVPPSTPSPLAVGEGRGRGRWHVRCPLFQVISTRGLEQPFRKYRRALPLPLLRERGEGVVGGTSDVRCSRSPVLAAWNNHFGSAAEYSPLPLRERAGVRGHTRRRYRSLVVGNSSRPR